MEYVAIPLVFIKRMFSIFSRGSSSLLYKPYQAIPAQDRVALNSFQIILNRSYLQDLMFKGHCDYIH